MYMLPGKMFPAWILVAFKAHHVSVGLLAAPALLMSPLGGPRPALCRTAAAVVAALQVASITTWREGVRQVVFLNRITELLVY